MNRPLLLLMLTGCAGLTPSSFREDQARLTCERKEECPDAATGADCSQATDPGASELYDCDFDAEKAQSCLDAIPQAECQGSTIAFQPVCGEVFTGCERQ